MTVTLPERPLGLRVRDVREYRGLDYRAAAAEIGIAVGQLHRLENDGTLDPRTSTVRKVEAWLQEHGPAPLAADRIPGVIDVPTFGDPDAVIELDPRAVWTLPPAGLVLWEVVIDEADDDYDRFQRCIVWAHSPEHAEEIVRAADRYPDQQADPIMRGKWIECPEWKLHVHPAPTSGIVLVHWHAG